MNKTLKYVLYALIALALVFGFVKIFGGPTTLQEASAFEWEKSVNVYFGNSKMGSSEDCAKVFPLTRVIPNAETLGPGALISLIQGLNQSEKGQGYFSSLNEGILINKFEVKDGVAYVDFSSDLNKGLGGSCRVWAIKSQIETTLNELSDINSVVISVDGQTEGILEP